MITRGIWTVLGVNGTVYRTLLTCWGRKADDTRMWSPNLRPPYINMRMYTESSGVTVPFHYTLSHFYSQRLPASSPFLLFPMNLWISYYCTWLLLNPLRLDPSKLNSGQFIELAVSEEAVMLYEFFTSSFSCLVCYISLHSAGLLLNVLSPYLQHVACLTPTHPTSACTFKALQYVWLVNKMIFQFAVALFFLIFWQEKKLLNKKVFLQCVSRKLTTELHFM